MYFLLIFNSSVHPIKSSNFTLSGLLSMATFQYFCIINFTDVHFNFQFSFHLCLLLSLYTYLKKQYQMRTFAYQQICEHLPLSGLEDYTKESVSHSDVTFEDAITAVAESNLLITWRVQRWAVCEINLMFSVTRQDKMPVFLEYSRIGHSTKVKRKSGEISDLNEIFRVLKQKELYILHIFSVSNTHGASFVMPALQEEACLS